MGARAVLRRVWPAALASGALATLILWQFYSLYWYPPDEGNYAHVAQRLLRGEVLHRDIQDVHAGYIDFVSAGAFALFGESLVSLRYPIVLLNIVQAMLVVKILHFRGPLLAMAAGVGSVCLGYLLFPNPSANWYCLFLIITCMALLSQRKTLLTRDLVACGVLCGLVLMFRQLSGAIFGAAVLLMLATVPPANGARAGTLGGPLHLSRIIVLVVGIGVVCYSAFATDATGFLLFGLGPFCLCGMALRAAPLQDRQVAKRLGAFVAGILVGLAPMIFYLQSTHSWRAFTSNAVLAALDLPTAPLFGDRSYASYLVVGVSALVTGRMGPSMAGAFWLFSVTAGLQLLRLIIKQVRGGTSIGELGAATVLGCFGGLLSVHLASPLYVGAGVPLVLIGLLARSRMKAGIWAGICVAASAQVLIWQVGQRRSFPFLWGQPKPALVVPAVPKIGLSVSVRSAELYQHLVGSIRAASFRNEPIFSLPSHAELYFLAERENPTWFFSLAQGVRNDGEYARLQGILRETPPRIVIVDLADPLWTPYAAKLAQWAAGKAERREQVGSFAIFTLPRVSPLPR